MAEIRKIIPRAALSDFRQQVQPGPNAFSVLAGVAQSAYDFLEPAAIEEMKRKGMADWSGVAGSTVTQSTSGRPGGGPSQALADDAMFAIGKDKLHGTDPRIAEVVQEAANNLGIKLGVSEGLRSQERQAQMVAEGKSQTMNSKHRDGHAVDFHIIGPDGKSDWSFESYRPLAEEAKRVAAAKGYQGFEWGGDWKTLKDGVHFQFNDAGAGLVAAANGTAGPEKYRDAIGNLESRGSGDYAAVGATDPKLGRALGRYGIMEANVGPWSKEVLGREVTADEFMADPSIQDAIFDAKFGQYVQKYGEEGAAQAWLGGPGNVGNTSQPDSLGTSVGEYGQKFLAELGGTSVTASAKDPVMVRTKDGVKPRLFSPMSGPILQAYNAAAGVAYLSEKMVQGQTDLIGMANDFTLDPQGFQQAAEAYIAQMADDAPEQFRADLTMELRSKAQQTFLGIVEDQQRDTRQRAANSSAALVDRWSSDYSDALASGNSAEAAAAEAKLRGVLQARESMPGLAWTPEQSENVVISAKKAAAAAVEKAQKEAETTVKGTLNTIIDAAKAGMTAADESILRDPKVAQIAPELFREATAFTTLRDQIPTFNTMSPVQQQAALTEMKSQPVTEDWEVDLYAAAEKVAAENAAKWIEDPIKRAREVLTDDPPPEIPEFDPMKPEAFLNGLKERAVYSQRLMDGNYTKGPEYLDNAEAERFGAMVGKDVDPEIKAGIVGAIVGAMGPDAGEFFKEIKTSDPVLPHIGALMASGGDNTVAVEALQGQALIDQKVVPAPSATAVAKGRAPVESALRSTPGALQAMEGVQKTAEAIYAARVPANADEDTQAKVMQEAWQAALGQQVKRKVLYGGIQKIGGQDVLLPPKVSGVALDGALKAAFGDPGGFWSWAPKVDGNPDMWMAAAGGIPALGGKPLSPDLWLNGEIALTPMGGNMYRLTFQRGDNEPQDVRFLGRNDDMPFVFDVEALIGASLVP